MMAFGGPFGGKKAWGADSWVDIAQRDPTQPYVQPAAATTTPATTAPTANTGWDWKGAQENVYTGAAPTAAQTQLQGTTGFAGLNAEKWTGGSEDVYTGPGSAKGTYTGNANPDYWYEATGKATAAANASGFATGSYGWGKAYNDEFNRAINEVNSRYGFELYSIPQDAYQNIPMGATGEQPVQAYVAEGQAAPAVATTGVPSMGTPSEQWNEANAGWFMGKPETADYYDAWKARFGTTGENAPPLGTNQQDMLNAWKASHPDMGYDANLGAYYDNQRRLASEKLESSSAATGRYGTSGYNDMNAEMLMNFGAQQAKDEADFRLRAAEENRLQDRLGRDLAAGADEQTIAQDRAMLAWAEQGGTAGAQAESDWLGRKQAGTSAAAQATAGKQAAQNAMWSQVSGLAGDEAAATQYAMNALINGDDSLMDRSIQAKLGVTEEAVRAYTQKSAQEREGMGDALSVLSWLKNYKKT